MAKLSSRPSRTPTSRATPIKGFSLLEILLVTGLVSVLGAITLVNFADARVRAQVSRAKADMRTIATALELYFVDYNDLPPNPSVPDAEVPRGAENAKPITGYNVTPFQITTPVAYLNDETEGPLSSGPRTDL